MNLIRYGDLIINLDKILFIVLEQSEEDKLWRIFLSDNSERELNISFESEELARQFMDKFECANFDFS